MDLVRAATIAITFSLALLSHGQSAGNTPEAATTVQARTNLVTVDVTVTRNGTPVHGLSKDAFHISDNGKPQTVTVFERHDGGEPVEVLPTLKLEPDVYANLPEFTGAGTANVILLDALNTPVEDQQMVRQKMLLYLRSIPAGTQIAVFTLASRLRIVQGFTADSTALAKAITAKGTLEPSPLLDGQQQVDSAMNLAQMGAADETIGSLQQFEADMAAFETDVRVRQTLDALKKIARYLEAVPGRKNLIWISGAFPLQINPDPALDNPFVEMRNYSEDVREADDLLAEARVAVYPVDGRGLQLSPSMNASQSGASMGIGTRSAGRNGGNSSFGSGGIGKIQSQADHADAKFRQQTMEEHFSMEQIAQETGGQAYFNTNAIAEAAGKAMTNGASYYTVGYVPELKKYDGSYHRLKIAVDGGNAAAYRRGYFADDLPTNRTPAKSPKEALASALTPWTPPVSDVLFKVRVMAASDPAAAAMKLSPEPAGALAKNLKGPVHRYLISFGVAAGGLTLTNEAAGGHNARLEFGAVAYDSDGRRLNYVDNNVEFKLTPALYERVVHDGIPYRQEIDLPAGRTVLRIVVQDLPSNRIGALEVPIVIGKK